MPTTVEEVRRHLQRDPALADTLARGIANLRRAARWMIAQYGWDATEEAVVSGLRRYAEQHTVPPLWVDRDRMQASQVGLRTGLALVSVNRSFELHEAMRKLWSLVGPYDYTAVLPGRRTLRLLIDRFDLTAVRGVLPVRSVEDVTAPVAAVEVTLPKAEGRDGDLQILSQLVGVLVHQGVPILEVTTCSPEALIFVPEAQAIEAYESAIRLVEQLGEEDLDS